MISLEGKIGLVCGVANQRSIAWVVAQAWRDAGAIIVYTYQDERQRKSIQELIGSFSDDSMLLRCDVAHDSDIETVYKTISEK